MSQTGSHQPPQKSRSSCLSNTVFAAVVGGVFTILASILTPIVERYLDGSLNTTTTVSLQQPSPTQDQTPVIRVVTAEFTRSSPMITATIEQEAAVERVTRNTQWLPVSRIFEGIEMMLVPSGCFMMGSTDSQEDEEPVHRQCLERPYWIDKTEVTNAAYGSSGYFSGANFPRESVSWMEAYQHCQSRGARLPNEVEWEYAARGPDSLKYPWGNSFVHSNINYFPEFDINTNVNPPPDSRTVPVGSFPQAASWVGALDMSGNVSEWVNSRYSGSTSGSVYYYPYNASDGREAYSGASDTLWVTRGGSWGRDASRATTHFRNFSSAVPAANRGYFTGFRCVRDYNEGDVSR
jgi:formylglycine-generating enzyme required for sulfatase activity